MASIRKKLSTALGLNGDRSSTNQASRMDTNRNSIDSGYQSMIAASKRRNSDGLRANTFRTVGIESSPERSPKKLHKAISSTFSGAMQAFSNSVRSTTSYIYPTAGEPELPSTEWAECETPEKESRRSSIMSSIRSRKQRSNPRTPDNKIESTEMLRSPVSKIQVDAPALEVAIPNPSFSYESLEKVSGSNGSQLLTGVKLPAAPKKLWPGPTRLTSEQALDEEKRGIRCYASPEIDDPYVEQGDGLQLGLSLITSSPKFALDSQSPPANKSHLSDENGYCSDVESNADVSASDGLSPACLKYVAPGSSEARTNSPCRHTNPTTSHINATVSVSACVRAIPLTTLRSEVSKPNSLDGTAERTLCVQTPSGISSHHDNGLNDDINALSRSCNVTTSKARSLRRRLPSDVYDADAESLESSMGSRAAWERHRADRERRYMEIVDIAPKTESDEETGPELELRRSPSKKSVHYAEELMQAGDLRYAVEAIERPAFSVGDLRYAVEAIERPSITTFDPLEMVFQQRPMLRLRDMIDEPESINRSDSRAVTSSHTGGSSSSPAGLSSSSGKLPSSPESFPVDILEAPESTIMTMGLTEGELVTLEAKDCDSNSSNRLSSESSSIRATSSPGQRSHTAPDDIGLKAEALFAPTPLLHPPKTGPVEEDAFEAGRGSAGIYMPIELSDTVQTRPATNSLCDGDPNAASLFASIFDESSYGTDRKKLEAASILLKQRSRNGAPFEHSRTVSACSDDTDDSCAIATNSPSCSAPLPFPSLHVGSEPRRRISSATDALATDGDEQLRIAGRQNGGVKPSLPSLLDGLGDQTDEAELKVLSPRTGNGEQSTYDSYAQIPEPSELSIPSPSDTSSLQFSSNNDKFPQEMFNATKLPSLVSRSPIASREARREQKGCSTGGRTVPFANRTTDTTRITEPEYTTFEPELNKNSVINKMQMSPGIARGSIQKPSPNRGVIRRNRRKRDPMTFSPLGTKISRAKAKKSGNICKKEKVAVKDSELRSEPDSNIKHSNFMRDVLSLHANAELDGTSYVDHELGRIFHTNSPEYSRQRLDESVQQDNDEAAFYCASGDEAFGNGSESDKDDAPRVSGQKDNGKLHLGAKEKLAVQKQLEQKSDRACSRLASKLKVGAAKDDRVREDDLAHKDGRPLWRP